MAPPPHLPVQCSKTKTLQGFGSLLGYLPFLLTLLIGGGIVICYCMAVAYGHVEAAFPYIRLFLKILSSFMTFRVMPNILLSCWMVHDAHFNSLINGICCLIYLLLFIRSSKNSATLKLRPIESFVYDFK